MEEETGRMAEGKEQRTQSSIQSVLPPCLSHSTASDKNTVCFYCKCVGSSCVPAPSKSLIGGIDPSDSSPAGRTCRCSPSEDTDIRGPSSPKLQDRQVW